MKTELLTALVVMLLAGIRAFSQADHSACSKWNEYYQTSLH